MSKSLPSLIVAASEQCPDLLYATRFFAPDAFIFLEKKGRRILVLSDLEIDRGKAQARADEILAYSDIAKPFKRGTREPAFHTVLLAFLKQQRVQRARVPGTFPLGLAQILQQRGLALISQRGLFWPEREIKRPDELAALQRALAITQAGMGRGIEVLAASRVAGAGLRWARRPLTAEILRAEIDSAVLRAGGTPGQTIVAGGEQGRDPHERGHGPLPAHQLIILDVFPRDPRTGYYGDLTRTVVRGRASDAQRKMWETVRTGQAMALRGMLPGEDGKKLHESVKAFFKDQGYKTEQIEGRWGGFFHGTGHGLGLELHEPPRFQKTVFKVGQVLTVEPGLYYTGLGGARLEDVATVTPTGPALLSDFPHRLEI